MHDWGNKKSLPPSDRGLPHDLPPLLLLTARPMTRTKLPGCEEPDEKQTDSTLKKLLEVASTHRLEAGKT